MKISVIIPTYNQAQNIHIGLDSVPRHSLIETIVVNDGSTDNTQQVVEDYIKAHPEKKIRLYSWKKNKGVSYAVNKGLDEAKGDYVVLLGSDGDYFIKGFLENVLTNYLHKNYDLIFFDVIDKRKHIRRLNPQTITKYVGSVKLMRRGFIGDTRCPITKRRAEDVDFTVSLLMKKPKCFYTHQIGKFYNYPRENSLTWNARHGITNQYGFKKGE